MESNIDALDNKIEYYIHKMIEQIKTTESISVEIKRLIETKKKLKQEAE